MPASIEDVAKLANVSISTVSRVINRRNLVNEETCQRVEAAIRELRYRPNAFARGLMLRKSGIVGLVLPDLHGEFYSEIIRGANQQAREMGHNLLLSSALPGDDAESWLSALGQHALVDGLAIMVSDTMAAGIGPTLAELRIPIVVLDDEIDGVEHDAVIIDQREGALAMMRHLVEKCRAERIFFVGGLKTNIDTQARYKAYRDVLRQAGLRFHKDDVYYLDYTYESAYSAGEPKGARMGRAEAVRICRQRRNGGGNHRRGDRQQCRRAAGFGSRRFRRHARGPNDQPATDHGARADVEDGHDRHRAAVRTNRRAG